VENYRIARSSRLTVNSRQGRLSLALFKGSPPPVLDCPLLGKFPVWGLCTPLPAPCYVSTAIPAGTLAVKAGAYRPRHRCRLLGIENAAGDVLRFACQPGDITRRWTPSFSVGLAELHGSLRITPPALLLRKSPCVAAYRHFQPPTHPDLLSRSALDCEP